MTSNEAPATAFLNRRRFLRNAVTAAGAVALPAPTAADEDADAFRPAESPESAAAWEEFQRQLTQVLPDLSEDEYLIIAHKRTNHFVQFAAQGRHGMRAEAVANAFLEPGAQLSKKAIAGLVAMGWHAPTFELKKTLKEEPVDGSPNFYLDAATPVPYSQLAGLAVRTLRETYRVRHPGELEYAAASTSDDFVSIRFPSLGVKRRSTE